MNSPLSDSKDPSTNNLSSETQAALRLKMAAGVGPRLFGDLVDHFGSAAAVFEATPEAWKSVTGVGPSVIRGLLASETESVQPQLEICRQAGIELMTPGQGAYPELLTEIYDPPSILFCQGQLTPADAVAIAIVGTRHATHYGKKIAEQLARGLSLAGVTIVSGMARGIDSVAHRATLQAGGRTIAVLGGGLLNVYPPEHASLATEIANQGAVLSESLPRSAPKSGSFPRRNRIISGLSLGVIVIEAGMRSGALISARMAMEQGREVFAVPGRIDSRMSQGCHQLIKDGAKLVQNIDDVLEELGPLAHPAETETGHIVRRPAELKLTEQETKVLNAIETEPTDIDIIVAKTELPVARVLATISVLEMRRLVNRVSGTRLVRV